MKMETANEKLDFEKVWFMFQETDKKFQETNLKFQETDKKFQQSERMLTEKFQETDKELKELIKKSKEDNKQMAALNKLFINHWGVLVETFVEGKLIELLNERNIPVNQTTRRYEAKYNGKDYEFDIIALNGTEIVVVEVKTTLNIGYVNYFIEKLKIIKDAIPLYKPFNIIGAMAYISSSEESPKYAAKNGLLTIRATGDSAFITNKKDFKPKVW